MTEDGGQTLENAATRHPDSPSSVFRTSINDLLRDSEGEVSEAQRDSALLDAVREYSRYRPDVKVADVAGAGSRLIPLPPGWVRDFSVIHAIEYPIGQVPPVRLSEHDFYRSPDEIKIILPFTVMETEQIRITFTVCHIVDSDEGTVPARDREAVCHYAAAALFDQLAAIHAGDQDSTIQSDSVDHQGKADVYRRQANSLRKRFYMHLGIQANRTPPAGAVVDLDMPGSRGHDRLTHSNRHR